MSHKEVMETLGQHANPNAHWDYVVVPQLYNILLFVGVILLLVFLAWLGVYDKPTTGNRRNPPT